jgi:D-threo-aldose 1-dehydrogenase
MSCIDDYRALRNGLKLPRLGFGGGSVFCVVPEIEAAGLMDHAYDKGFRYFDTAPFYGH